MKLGANSVLFGGHPLETADKCIAFAGYDGPVNLEVIGAKEYDEARCASIAAEIRGHMQACLQACGAR